MSPKASLRFHTIFLRPPVLDALCASASMRTSSVLKSSLISKHATCSGSERGFISRYRPIASARSAFVASGGLLKYTWPNKTILHVLLLRNNTKAPASPESKYSGEFATYSMFKTSGGVRVS